MKQILLRNRGGYPTGLFTLVDDEDYSWLDTFKWYKCARKSSVYAATRISTIEVFMQNLLLPSDNSLIEVDHINTNGLDNQRLNLRYATRSQNNGNQSIKSNNSSGFKGVSWDKVNKKWNAYITCKGIRRNLGRFVTIEEAALTYNKAALELFGEFARLNEIL